MGMFKKGYRAVEEEKKRQDETKAKSAKNIWRFYLKDDGDEADVRFLTEEPVSFYEHSIKTIKSGKEHYDSVVCTQDKNCPLCAQGDTATFKGAFLIWDMRPYETTDEKGKKKKVSGTLRLYVQGAKVLSQIARISNKYGISNRLITIARLGKGNKTSYTIERGDEEDKFTKSEVTNMLPEALRPFYKGTMDSLYDIVEECLSASIVDADEDYTEKNSTDEEDDEEYDNRKNLVQDDDDEDERPVKRKPVVGNKSKLSLGKKKPTESSVKKVFKKSR